MLTQAKQDLLCLLYVDQKRGAPEIAPHFGVSVATIYNWLRAMNIPRRSMREIKHGKPLPLHVLEARVRAGRTYTLAGYPTIGAKLNAEGYVSLHRPEHPDADSLGYVLEHRLVVEKRVGRRLLSTEHVQHRNHQRADNRDENLELLDRGVHSTQHNLKRSKELSARARIRERDLDGRWV